MNTQANKTSTMPNFNDAIITLKYKYLITISQSTGSINKGFNSKEEAILAFQEAIMGNQDKDISIELLYAGWLSNFKIPVDIDAAGYSLVSPTYAKILNSHLQIGNYTKIAKIM